MRRQTGAGGLELAGSSRHARLDPFALPLCFAAEDARADGGTRLVELHRQRVIVRRAVRGMTMAVNLPLHAYRGVALRLDPADATQPGGTSVVLEHVDPGLSVVLYAAPDGNDIVAEWHSWARVLGVPLLVADGDGGLRDAFPRIGPMRIGRVKPRRRRRSPVRWRRPGFLTRRSSGRMERMATVHRGEREIIARH